MTLPPDLEPDVTPPRGDTASRRRAREHRHDAARALDHGDPAVALVHAMLALEARTAEQAHAIEDLTEALRHATRYIG